jgi:hypothetical protein
MDGCNLAATLEELKAILISPLKPVTQPGIQEGEETDNRSAIDQEDIPGQFTKVLDKGNSFFSIFSILSDLSDCVVCTVRCLLLASQYLL